MSKRSYTVSDAILDTLKAHNVSTIFGYPGGAILPFYDALPYHDIKHILVRNEQGAAFAAQGWARVTKQIGVCCSTSGPGATNLITGIADAYLDSIPLLCITGQVPLSMIGKDMFQEVDVTGLTLNITKHNYLVDDPEKIVHIVSEAIAIATSCRPGPVHIDVPKDVMASKHPRVFKIPKIRIETDPMSKAYDRVNDSVLQCVFDALNNAKRPVLLIGHGVKHSHAEKALLEFIEKTGIPTVSTLLAKGIVPKNHTCYLSMLGMHGFYHTNFAVHNADVILNIGTRFSDRIVGRYDVFRKNTTVIHVDIDKSELSKVVESDIAIHSDALKFLEQLLSHKDLKKLNIDSWWKQIRKWESEQPYERETSYFSIRNVLSALNTEIEKHPAKYILAADVGQHQMWTSLSCMAPSSDAWLTSGGAGTMGFALPSSLGAAFAAPSKTVLCVCGDGGIQMNIQELGTLAAYGLSVKVCILNNNYLGMVRQWQELFYEHNYSAVEITSPDYAALAEAYGIPGYTVRGEEEMRAVHAEIFAMPGPCVIDYHVEKEDNVFPMVPGGKTLGETIMRSGP